MNIYGLKHYCCEDFSNIEGYKEALENPNVEYHCHHRLEIQEDKILSVKELIDLGLYYNRPASELIILTKQEHLDLHNKAYKSIRLSEEVRKKISEANKGKTYSEEAKMKMSKAHKGKHVSEETKKRLSKAFKTLRWFNNGEICIRAKECPEGFVPGRLKRKSRLLKRR